MELVTRDRVVAVRHQLLELHKALADAERQTVERTSGRLTGGEYLQLLINDPSLSWLLALSGIIVRLDELLEQDDTAQDDMSASIAEVRRLLTPNAEGNEFQRRYAALMQDSPAVVLAHGATLRALAS
jgi:hypothetical protein